MTKKRLTPWLTAILLLAMPSLGLASIVSIIAGATVLEDFQFNDTVGTAYSVAANNAGTGNLWSVDTDLAGVATNGAGALNASAKANTEFGSTLVDTQNYSSGRFLAMMSLTWSFRSNLNANELEEIRLGFIDSGLPTPTADITIARTALNKLEISGDAFGAGGTAVAAQVLNGGSLEQLVQFIAVLLVDLDAHTYETHFSADDGVTYGLLGSGMLDPSRGIDTLRLVLNNDLSSDNVLIDRITMARVNATEIPEPSTALLVGCAFAIAIALRRRASAPA